jgi:hypothetical protein
MYLNFYKISLDIHGAIYIYIIFVRSTNSERDFDTLAKVKRPSLLKYNCWEGSKLLVSQYL